MEPGSVFDTALPSQIQSSHVVLGWTLQSFSSNVRQENIKRAIYMTM